MRCDKCATLRDSLRRARSRASTVEPVLVDPAANSIITQAIDKNMGQATTLEQLFLQQQVEYQRLGGHAMRWHPLIVRWALTLHQKSKAAYRTMRETGFIHLPSERTLNEYAHSRSICPGVDIDGLLQFAERKRDESFAVLVDEMRIRDGICYRQSTGEMMGYAALGSLNEAIHDKRDQLATHAVVFMLQGVKKRDTIVAATYFSTSASSTELYSMLWEVGQNI